eukprot:190438-Pleurochrysis_carterae.AAC.1
MRALATTPASRTRSTVTGPSSLVMWIRSRTRKCTATTPTPSTRERQQDVLRPGRSCRSTRTLGG